MTTRDEYIDSIKEAFSTIGNKVAIAFILKNVPFLGNWFFNPIVSFFVGIVMKALVTEAETQAFFLYTDFRVGEQSIAFEKAALWNAKLQRDPNASKQEKLAAENNLRSEFAKFVRLTS